VDPTLKTRSGDSPRTVGTAWTAYHTSSPRPAEAGLLSFDSESVLRTNNAPHLITVPLARRAAGPLIRVRQHGLELPSFAFIASKLCDLLLRQDHLPVDGTAAGRWSPKPPCRESSPSHRGPRRPPGSVCDSCRGLDAAVANRSLTLDVRTSGREPRGVACRRPWSHTDPRSGSRPLRPYVPRNQRRICPSV